jgi:hypothetical protein
MEEAGIESQGLPGCSEPVPGHHHGASPEENGKGENKMEIGNAFVGKPGPPEPEDVAAALKAASSAWVEFLDWMAKAKGVTEQEWRQYGRNSGWTLLLKLKKRTIVYLGPCQGCFRVALVLGHRAMKAVRETRLSKIVARAVSEAPHYPEGWGIRLVVRRPADLGSIRKLVAAKLEC